MKILILTTELSVRNGWARYSLDMVHALQKQGMTPVVVVNSQNINETTIETIKILPHFRNYVLNFLTSFWYAWKLRKLAKDCDRIHAFVESYSGVAYFLQILTGKEYVVTTHGTYGVLPFKFSLPVRWFHKKTFLTAKKVVCVSTYTATALQSYGIYNTTVINNGITFEKFNKGEVPALELREDILLSVGALKYRKGQHIALQAFAKIASTSPQLKYYVVGEQSDAEYFQKLKNIATDVHVENRVHFLSGISDSELLKLYKKAKVFVLPTLNKGAHFEGFGLVYLEANACGLPVIGSFESGAEDAIKNGETGILVTQGDSDAVAEAIISLLSKENIWRNMSTAGLVWAKEHDWKQIIEHYVTLYKSRI